MWRRLAPFLVAAAVALASIAALLVHPAVAADRRRADYVIIAGAPGLRWDDLSPTGTPTLWRLASAGSVGALSVRSARTLTCPSDGWLTLGAGNLALRPGARSTTPCPLTTVPMDDADGIGSMVTDQRDVVDDNAARTWGARPGALAESVRCTVAVGPGAAIAAARPIGRVDRYVNSLPDDPSDLLRQCVLAVVDLGTVSGEAAARRRTVEQVDARAALMLAGRPPSSLVLVAGLADTEEPARLHVAIADGPGYEAGWLGSPSTGRAGYLQLIDLAPTALSALGVDGRPAFFAGLPASRVGDRPGDLAPALHELSDADLGASVQRGISARFYVALGAAQLLLLAAAIPVLRRARRRSGPHEPGPVPAPVRRGMEALLVAAALALPAALLAGLMPGWRSTGGGLFGLGLAVGLAVVTTFTLVSPMRRHTLGPTAVAAGVAATVVVLDLLSGAHLQLNGVGGYSALDAVRYAGLGTTGLGVICGGLLLAAGCLAQQAPRRWRPVCVAVLGGVGVMVVGSPYLGADTAGAIALTAGVCVTAAMSNGGWLTISRLSWAVLSGVAVTAGFAVLDLRRSPDQRGSLGRFLAAVQEGSAGQLIQRTNAENVLSVVRSPLAVLAVAAAVFVFFVLLRPWGGLKRLFGIYPAVRAAAAGVVVSSLLGGLLNGAGLTVAGAAAATTLPLVALAALRVLAHADERTGALPAARSVPEELPAAVAPRAAVSSPTVAAVTAALAPRPRPADDTSRSDAREPTDVLP
jgi:hypothetical protein